MVHMYFLVFFLLFLLPLLFFMIAEELSGNMIFFVLISPPHYAPLIIAFSAHSQRLELCGNCLVLTWGWVRHYLQITGEPVGEVKEVADMHQRKAEMARQSDAFVALPGCYKDL